MRVTTKRQVTIPVEIREKAGLLPHTEVEFELDAEGVCIRRAKAPGVKGAARPRWGGYAVGRPFA